MPFKYLRDPLWLACVLLYLVNRLALKPLLAPNFAGGFFHSHLNDLICIPFWVPLMLWLMRLSGARRDDAPPRAHEILIPLVLWSWLFEWLLPQLPAFKRVAFADPVDVLAYASGALGASLWWHWRHPTSP